MTTNAGETENGDENGVSITLMERGSRWPEHGSVIPPAMSENIVMVQSASESTDAFTARVADRLNEVRALGWPLKSATLLASGRSANGSRVASGRLAALLGGFLAEEGNLTLMGGKALSSDARAELAGTAATLSELFGPSSSVRLVLEPDHSHSDLSEQAA